MTLQPGPLDPESLTELVLQGADVHVKQVFGADTLAEYEDLAAFVGACREAAAVDLQDHSLAERALLAARSEDLSWRGDLQLLKGFVGDRLRSSMLLRLAAASLLVHIAALPVVAYFVLTEEAVVPEFRVEVGHRELPYAVNDDSEQVDASLVELHAMDGLSTLLVENTLRWSRWQLSMSQDPREGSGLRSPSWLDQRAGILWGGDRLAPSVAPASAFVAAELALDEFLVSDGSVLARDAANSLLEPMLEWVGSSSDTRTWLALSSLARAESYGVLDEGARTALRRARNTMPLDHRFRGLIEVEGDLRRRLPLDSLWVQAISELDPVDTVSDWVERLREISELGDR